MHDDVIASATSPALPNIDEYDLEDEIGVCPFCGTTGVGFADAEPPSDYCGHDTALIRPRTCGAAEN